MDIQDLGAIGEFVGAIFIVVTLVYLIVQLRQNTTSIRSQSRYFVLEALSADMRLGATPEYGALRVKVLRREATPAERGHWAMTLASLLSHQEMLYYELEDHALPPEFGETLRSRVAASLIEPDATNVWRNTRRLYTSSFQDYVDEVARQDPGSILGPDYVRYPESAPLALRLLGANAGTARPIPTHRRNLASRRSAVTSSTDPGRQNAPVSGPSRR